MLLPPSASPPPSETWGTTPASLSGLMFRQHLYDNHHYPPDSALSPPRPNPAGSISHQDL